MNHVSVSPTDGNGAHTRTVEGQRKTLTVSYAREITVWIPFSLVCWYRGSLITSTETNISIAFAVTFFYEMNGVR